MARPYNDATFEDYGCVLGLERFGEVKWREYAGDIVVRFIKALKPDDVVLGEGNTR